MIGKTGTTVGHRVAIVTEYLAGISEDGDTGSWANSLVRIFLSAHSEVDVIVTGESYRNSSENLCDARVLSLALWLDRNNYSSSDHLVEAYGVCEMLRQKTYDAVHFIDSCGRGYFYAMAKRQGLVNATIISHAQRPSKWARIYNVEFASIDATEIDVLERIQIENSDYIVSPSQYMLDWYSKNGIILPKSRVISWLLPEWLDRGVATLSGELVTKNLAPNSVTELIFFDHYERRKGLDLFLSAIRSNPKLQHLNLVFIGQFGHIDDEFTGSKIFRSLPDHVGAIRFFNDDNIKNTTYLLHKKEHALVIMPSLIENSPCLIGHCFTTGTPFAATAVGGISELLMDGENSQNLFEKSPEALAALLVKVIKDGMAGVSSKLVPTKILESWLKLHYDTLRVKPTKPRARTPNVSVCLVHHNRANLLRRALLALKKQTYSYFEVIIVDDGSDKKNLEDLALIELEEYPFPLRVVRSSNNYLGAARNLAAKHATGEFLVFHDDDNVSEPTQLEVFVRAVEVGGYDILTAQFYIFDETQQPEDGKILEIQMGAGGAFSFFRNRFGDANAIVRKSVFEKLGGFSELKGVGLEDWDFFLRAYLAATKIGTVPEPLFRYRVSVDGMRLSTSPALNHARIVAAAASHAPLLSQDLLELAQRDAVRQSVRDHTWKVVGRTKCPSLHWDLMALDPNSDAARFKLMELAFDSQRIADAIEIGLSVRQGFHRVFSLLDLVGPRFQVITKISSVKAGSKIISSQAIMIRGWVTPIDTDVRVAKEIVYDDEIYRIIRWEPEYRPDVNNHLGFDDSSLRGFRAVAVASEIPRKKKGFAFVSRRNARAESGTSVELTVQPDIGSMKLRFLRNESRLAPRKGSLDSLDRCHLIEVILPNLSTIYMDKITIQTEPKKNIYFVDDHDPQIVELTTDEFGFADLHVPMLNQIKKNSADARNIWILVAGSSVPIYFTLYTLI